MDMSDNAGM